MAHADYRVYFDNVAASADQLARLAELRVDQGIGIAAEAELDLAIGTDDHGLWSGIEEDFALPFRRVRIEVKVGGGNYVPLIDGPVVGNRYELAAAPDQSKMTIVVQDDSVLLNRDESVRLFEDMAPQDIVSGLFNDAGLTPDVDSVPGAGAALQRVVVQRGTPMQLLRELARRHGMFVYVRPGEQPGAGIGAFKLPKFAATDLPQILLVGADRNVSRFSAEFDALRPVTARAGSVALADRTVLASVADSAGVAALGPNPAHGLTQPALTLLTGTREEQADLDAATSAAADISSWAYAASGELEADAYEGVLQPYRIVTVRGIGGWLSGDYLVGRVQHVLGDSGYTQRFTLHRNARSAGSGGGGGLPGGVF